MAMQMKDSGIEWIGEIPADWELEKMKYHMRINPVVSNDANAIDDDAEVSFVPMENLHNGFHEVSTMPYSKMKTGYTEFREGDILIAKVTPCFENGNIAEAKNLLSGRGFGSTEILVIRCPKKYARYIYYYLQNPAFKIRAISEMYGVAGLKRIPPTFFKESYIPIPSDNQQVKIADFLDSRCAEIDAVIAAKQRQNELLKEQRQSIIFEAVTKGLDPTVTYKDSGVEWIGEIPAGWNAFKIKHIVAVPVTDGPHESPQLVDEGIPFISAEAVKGNKLDFSLMRGYISKEDHEVYCKKVRPQREDIFVVKSGATTGAIAIVDTDDEFSIWSPLAMVRSKKPEYIQRFVYYAMLSDSFRKQIELGWNFGTQQNLGMNVLENLYIACPLSTSVQQQIADYLDIRCAELDRVVSANNAVIDKLKEYRQSLIYEAVTGKIAV